MKRVLIWNLFLLLGALSSAAFATEGGVGSGGGGTTNPEPADKEWIVNGTRDYGAKVIIAWLQNEEEFFRQRSDKEELASYYAKLFRPTNGKNIYDVVKNTEIEYRMSEPCRDSEGEPADGSIYGTKPGSICISPFTMAPKLNVYNTDAETFALLVHEYSHLMGASESEAVKLQQHALYSFIKLDMMDVVAKIDLLGSSQGTDHSLRQIDMLRFNLRFAERYLENGVAEKSTYSDLIRDFIEIRREISEELRSLLLVKPEMAGMITANLARLQFVENAVCALDPKQDADTRMYCLERMNTGFGKDSTLNLRTYMAREQGIDESGLDEEIATIQVTKPYAQRDLVPQIEEVLSHLQRVQQSIDELRGLHLPGYRTN